MTSHQELKDILYHECTFRPLISCCNVIIKNQDTVRNNEPRGMSEFLSEQNYKT